MAPNGTPAFTILLGTYERTIYGLDVARSDDDDATLTLTPAYIMPVHGGSVRCIAGSADGAHMASGSVDETIRLFDTASRRALGHLMPQHGTIQALAFHTRHLVVAYADGVLEVYRTRDWACLKTLHGHRYADPSPPPRARVCVCCLWQVCVGRPWKTCSSIRPVRWR